MDVIWKLKPIRYIIRRQLHDTVAGEIRMKNVHESIQLHHGIEDTIDIRLLLIPLSALNYKNHISAIQKLEGMHEMEQDRTGKRKMD